MRMDGLRRLVVLFLLGASTGCASELYNAAERGDLKAVRTLVDQGAVINDSSGIDGEVPLVGAAKSGKLDVVQFLLDRGADVNMTDGFDATALHAAAEGGSLPIVQLLLDRGAAVNAQNRFKFTPLALAASKGHASIVRLLLERGADANLADYWGTPPLCGRSGMPGTRRSCNCCWSTARTQASKEGKLTSCRTGARP